MTLHILNGDTTLVKFKEANIDGEVAIWREVLSDGPTHMELGNDQFWETRSSFMRDFFEASREDYQRLTISEFHKIQNFNDYDQTVLWFEYDLFCQINLMALCSYINQNKKNTSDISIINCGKFKDSNKLLGLGEIDSSVYQTLLLQKTKLESEDLAFASKIWQVYNSNNHLQGFKGLIQKDHPKFKYIKPALTAHLERFPNDKSGINAIDKKILSIISEGQMNKNKIVRKLLLWQEWFGFGDLQYEIYLEQLSDCYDTNADIYTLNNKGIKLLEGDLNFQTINTKGNYTFGRAKKHSNKEF